ncbi:MAG: DNA methyltransferase, partial [Spirochaetia bacterium]
SALGGDLFNPSALGQLASCALANKHLVACLSSLDRFDDHETHQTIKVNYGALNVEEFGSVYEGLLEKDPVIIQIDGRPRFSFKAGEGRSSSGSHYTPEELTHPLIRHSLDHVITARLKQTDPEKALLSIRVCDPACGSGHILLNAARRIGLELARVRSGVEQPSPPDIREAVRDAIRHCLYGVDKNPHAVELCKVALWLESHGPGEPLGFLDHHIKSGDSVVGIARRDELLEGISGEAFKRQPGDDATASALAKRNRKERETRGQIALDLDEPTRDNLDAIRRGLLTVDGMSECSIEEIGEKRLAYENLVSQSEWIRLRDLADVLTAQFFIPKTEENKSALVTDGDYLQYVAGGSGSMYEARVKAARGTARERRFFHWFVEFPDVFGDGGFDCILGNPPFLGGLKISTNHGERYLHYLQSQYAPARGTCDLVGYFFRRNYSLIKDGGYFGLIATNTIAQGGTREGSLEPITRQGGEIVFAIRSMKWPGLAAVSVSLVAMHKGKWGAQRFLDGLEVARITPYLDDSEMIGNPYSLKENAGKGFIGSYVLGMGFVLEPYEALALIQKDPRNKDVLFPYLNGENLNGSPDQSPSRWVIQFDERDEEKARSYPDCFGTVEKKVKPERIVKDAKKYPRMVNEWWKFWNNRQELAHAIARLERVMIISRVSKTVAIAFASKANVFSEQVVVFAFSRYSVFALMQSAFHYYWSCKNSSTMKGDLRYAPSDCFETFPFPTCLRERATADTSVLESIGREYYQHRQALMSNMQLGLTKTYNLFHDAGIVPGATDLSALESQLKKSGARIGAMEAATRVQTLRDLHVKMDAAVLAAYGWSGLILGHDFHAVDFLPENDRVRFTISPQARREILKRLLALNHRYHAEEQAAEETKPKKSGKRKQAGHGPELGL